MEFCDNCKELLWPNGEKKMICISCDYQAEGELVSKEKMPKKKEVGEGPISDENLFATYKSECGKCGYDKAEVTIRDPMYSDEDNLIFLKCGKCSTVTQLSRKRS